jgi:hypothetical protein
MKTSINNTDRPYSLLEIGCTFYFLSQLFFFLFLPRKRTNPSHFRIPGLCHPGGSGLSLRRMRATPLPPTVTAHRADTQLFSERNGYYIRPFSVSLLRALLPFYRLLVFAELPSDRETTGLRSQQWRCSLPLCRYARTRSISSSELLVPYVALAV